MIAYSPETGRIEEILVRSQMTLAQYLVRANQLISSAKVFRDCKNCVLMPGTQTVATC